MLTKNDPGNYDNFVLVQKGGNIYVDFTYSVKDLKEH